jgi:hypothetical protein
MTCTTCLKFSFPFFLLASPAIADSGSGDTPLTTTVLQLDAKVFDAYNRCDLATFERYFAPNVEFYHDTGGATFDRKTVIANTRKYICHKVRRELIDASFKVYPVKDFGAIEEGEHRFCETSTGGCEGIAKFLIVWKQTHGRWQITRVLSYGHRAIGGD